MPRRLRVLVVTRLFPNAALPHAAAFNRQQLVALARLCDVELLAVIPWFPGARLFSSWSAAGRLSRVPRTERLDGLLVRHPRVLYVPKLDPLAPVLYVASLLRDVWLLPSRVDVVLGSWASPDGVAAVALSRLLAVPAVVKLHGSDMNALADRPGVRPWLTWALPRAARVVAVSRMLADKACALGAPVARLVVVPNGVDRDLFRPRDRTAARAALAAMGTGFPEGARGILYVGHMSRAKGVEDLIAAFRRIAAARSDIALALVGEGPEADRCRRAAAELDGRLVIAGSRSHEEVATWMAACDVLTLPSWSEGTPNVVLEAAASGRPVVATRTGGIPEVVSSPGQGELVAPRDVEGLADALVRVAEMRCNPAAIAAAAPGGWDESAARLLRVLQEAVSDAR